MSRNSLSVTEEKTDTFVWWLRGARARLGRVGAKTDIGELFLLTDTYHAINARFNCENSVLPISDAPPNPPSQLITWAYLQS